VRHPFLLRPALMFTLVVLGACATPIGVDRTNPQRVQREISASALTGDRPSSPTLEFLTRMNLREPFARDPRGTLDAIHAQLAPSGDMDRLYALAELSFLVAERTHDRDRALAAAVYSYAFLFDDASPRLDRFDPRVIVARHLYNRSLALGFASPVPTQVTLAAGRRTLPIGTLDVAMEPGELMWGGFELVTFTSVADFSVRGLDNRYRQAGIGAPLAATLGAPVGPVLPSQQYIPKRLRVPTTAVLRIDRPRAQLASGRVAGKLEVFGEDDRQRELLINGDVVPLELEKTFSLAYTLEGAPIWDFGFQGFRLGDFLPTSQGEQLVFLHPYQKGEIPLVLVHGTFSSPATWAQLVNELENDPEVGTRFQPWLFMYNSGNPVGWSAGILAETLQRVVTQLDPNGQDPALQQVVVVGHSQGGLLTKLMAVESGDTFWRQIARRPIDEVDLDPESRTLLKRSLFFHPKPFVSRVVFMSTPHRGSFLSDFRVSSWLSRLVKLPATMTKLTVSLATHGSDAFLLSSLGRMPTSLDNMASNNRFLRALTDLPIDPRITANSIIAVRGDGPPEQGNDGVVRFSSASIEGVESEYVVQPSGHSVQMTQPGIQELRRILLRHAGISTAPHVEPEASESPGGT
jgi:pimeloyl-ACP methyl ester carboxylesterase